MVESVFYITDKCNLSCKHCSIFKEDNELTFEQIEESLEKYPIENTILTGGEPLMHDRFSDIVDICPTPTILSNGLLVRDEENLEALKESQAVQLSVEVSEEITNEIRGNGVWDTVMKNRGFLEEEGVPNYLRSTYCKEQINEATNLMEFCEEKEISLVMFPRLDKPPMDAQTRSVFFDKAVETGTVIATPDFHSYIGDGGVCPAGRDRVSITSSGEIIPCQFWFDYILGSVELPWDEVKRSMRYFRNSDLVPTNCSYCDYSAQCRGCNVADTYIDCPMSFNMSHEKSPYEKSQGEVRETINFLEDIGAPKGCHGC